MPRLSVAVLAALMALAVQAPVSAADDPLCSTDALLSLVDTALTDQPSVPRLAARRYGARAAFLKIRYGQLTEDAAATLLNGLLDANVQGVEELALAWSTHMIGDHKALPRLAKDRPGTLSIALPPSAIRALLLTKNGADILMDRIAATPKDRLGGIAQAIMTAVIDQPDALKETIAQTVEKRNIPLISELIAAQLVTTEKNKDAWRDFILRRPAEQINTVRPVVYWLPALVGNPSLKRNNDAPEMAETRAAIHATVLAASLEPEFDFLNTYLNQTGDFRSTAAAAEAVKTAVDAGKVRPDGTLDAAWLIAYRALVEATGDRSSVDATLASVTIQTGRYASSGRVTVRDVIDHLLVVEALTPHVRGENQTQPEPPAELSETMKSKYADWLAMAEIVRSGAIAAEHTNDPMRLGMVSELLFAKSDIRGLAAVVDAAPAGEASVFTATDFAVRIDRHCASYLSHPAEAVLLAGQPIFKFDTKN